MISLVPSNYTAFWLWGNGRLHWDVDRAKGEEMLALLLPVPSPHDVMRAPTLGKCQAWERNSVVPGGTGLYLSFPHSLGSSQTQIDKLFPESVNSSFLSLLVTSKRGISQYSALPSKSPTCMVREKRETYFLWKWTWWHHVNKALLLMLEGNGK